MTRTIWKFPLKVTDIQDVLIPEGALTLHVADQNGVLCLWALVTPNSVKRSRKIWIFGTGHQMPDLPLLFLGTFMRHEGQLVFHAFLELE